MAEETQGAATAEVTPSVDSGAEGGIGAVAETEGNEPQTEQQNDTQGTPAEGNSAESEPEEQGIGAEDDNGEGAASEADYSTEGIELPEGVTLDDKVVGQLADVCKELKVSPEAFRAITSKMTPVLEARNAERIGEVRKQFLAQGRADKEMGGVNWDATKRSAGQAFKKFVDPETRALFVKVGLDCHPGVIRAFKRIQESVSDDVVVRGTPAAARNPLANFYDNSDMN